MLGPIDPGDHPTLKATIDTPIPAIIAGNSFQTTVRIENVSSQSIDFETGTELVVYLFRPGSTVPIGDGGGTHLVGRDHHLLPANGATMAANGGTTSCDSSLGYVLPPGAYEARALVDVSWLEPVSTVTFWSEPLRVDVLAR